MASLTIDVDLPPGVKITSYSRFEDGHGIEVEWPLPERCRCEKCGHEQTSPTSSSKRAPQVDSGTSTSGTSPLFGSIRLPSIAVGGAITASTSFPRSNAKTCPTHTASSSSYCGR